MVVLLLGIVSCSQVKSFFPDKKKDYQLTSEIPALHVPPDLSNHAIQTRPEVRMQRGAEAYQQHVAEAKPTVSKPATNAIAKKTGIYVELIEFSGGATRIRIADSMGKIWRTVGKSLSRHSIEIIHRNELGRVYSVLYDANFKKISDGSLWDEAMFIFGADPAQEEEFRIKLVEYGGLIEIFVLNSYDIPLSSGNGLKLLKMLYNTIKLDLAE